MISLVLPERIKRRSLFVPAAGTSRVYHSDFDRGATGCFNCTTVSPGYGTSAYAIESAEGLDPFGYPLPFGVPVPDIVEGQNYRLTAIAKGDIAPNYWNGRVQTLADWGVVSGVLRVMQSKSWLEYYNVGMLFSNGPTIGMVTIDSITPDLRAAYSDDIVASIGNGTDVADAEGSLASRLANMPLTLAKLQANAGRIRIAMVGDSLMADTSSGSLPELIKRSYPGTTVEARLWARGSTGVTGGEGGGWAYLDKSEIYAYAPDVVYQGGISDHYDTAADWATIISDYRANISGVEILVGGPVRAYPDGAATSAFMAGVAAANSVAFVDCGPAYYTWLASVGIEESQSNIMRDSTHMNYLGVEPISRIVAKFFGA